MVTLGCTKFSLDGCLGGLSGQVTLALWVVTSVDAHQRQSVGTRRTHTYVAIEHLNHVKQRDGS